MAPLHRSCVVVALWSVVTGYRLLESTPNLVTSGVSTPLPPVPFRHKWDTVSDVMGMHGKVMTRHEAGNLPADEALAFAAENYAMVTTGVSDCRGLKNEQTLEDYTLAMAEGIKFHNSDTLVGMYWRIDQAIEISQCSNGTQEYNRNPDWRLKQDDGEDAKTRNNNYLFDYSTEAFYKFFMGILLNTLKAKLPSGNPVLDYLFLDGAGGSSTQYAPGMDSASSEAQMAGLNRFISELQQKATELGYGQNILLNGVSTEDRAKRAASLGVAAVMVDHWSILEFLNRGNAAGANEGKFDVTKMRKLFNLVLSPLLSDMTLVIKGWVGPVIRQKAIWGGSVPGPESQADFQRIAGERFNSELALFLLVAEDTMYWQYSWFWDFYDWVPGPTSTVPSIFFPQAKCALGKPLGRPRPLRALGSGKYHRTYEHAYVFVDLTNRTASRVDFFKDCPSPP